MTTYGITPIAAALVFSLLALLTRVLAETVAFFDANRVDLALYINALTFLVSALTVLRIRRISGRPTGASTGPAPGVLRLLREGWAFIGHTPLVRGLVIGILGAFAAGGAVIGTSKTYAASLGGGDATYGILFGAVFVGLGLGMGLGPKVARDLSRRRLFGLSIVFAGACLVLVSLMPHLALSLICVIGVGFGAGTAYLAGTTLLGREVADEVRGRTFAFVQSLIRIDLILTLAAAPFLVGLLRQRRGRPRRRRLHRGRGPDPARARRPARHRRRHRVLPADGRPARGAGGARPGQRAARRHHHAAPAVPGWHAHRLRGRRGLGQVDAGAQARRVAHRAGGGGDHDARAGGDRLRPKVRSILLDSADGSLDPAGRGAALRRRPGPPRRHGDPARARSGRRGDHRPVRGLLARLPGGRAGAVRRGHPPAVPLGDQRAASGPHRAARRRPRRRAAAGPRRGRRRPAGAGVARLPPPGAAGVPGAGRRGAGPLPGGRREPPPGRGRRGGARGAGKRLAARLAAQRPVSRSERRPQWLRRTHRAEPARSAESAPPPAAEPPPGGAVPPEHRTDGTGRAAPAAPERRADARGGARRAPSTEPAPAAARVRPRAPDRRPGGVAPPSEQRDDAPGGLRR